MYWYHTPNQTSSTTTIWSKAATISQIRSSLMRQARLWPESFEGEVLVRVGKKRRDGLGFKTHGYYLFSQDKLVKQDWTDLSHWLPM